MRPSRSSLDLVTQHPEVNLIYSEASNLTVGTMAALTQAGRGKMNNGKPLTEIVCSVDFDEVEIKSVYDPNSSLKLSMGLPPDGDRARTHRPHHGHQERQGADRPRSRPRSSSTRPTTSPSGPCPRADAVKWLNDQFGTNIGL